MKLYDDIDTILALEIMPVVNSHEYNDTYTLLNLPKAVFLVYKIPVPRSSGYAGGGINGPRGTAHLRIKGYNYN